MGKYVVVGLADLRVGMKADFWQGDAAHGGEIVALDDAGDIVVHAGEARIARRFARDGVESGYYTVEVEVPFEARECIQYRAAVCRGEVEMFSPGGAARPLPRCEHHRNARQASFESGSERGAVSDVPPRRFDPGYAGENW